MIHYILLCHPSDIEKAVGAWCRLGKFQTVSRLLKAIGPATTEAQSLAIVNGARSYRNKVPGLVSVMDDIYERRVKAFTYPNGP